MRQNIEERIISLLRAKGPLTEQEIADTLKTRRVARLNPTNARSLEV